MKMGILKVGSWILRNRSNFTGLKQHVLGNSLAVQWLGLCASKAGGLGLSPHWGTKIPASGTAKKKKTKRVYYWKKIILAAIIYHLYHHCPKYFTEIKPFNFHVRTKNSQQLHYTDWRRQWQPTPVLLPWKSHGQRSLVQATVHGVAKSRARLSDFTSLHLHRWVSRHMERKMPSWWQ